MRLPLLALLTACSQGSSVPPPAPVEKPIAAAPIAAAPNAAELSALAVQLDAGKQLFAEHCASCHGDSGQGTDDGPSLAGKHALPVEPRPGSKRDVTFRTGADVYGFVANNMPADDPGTLTPEQYNAVVAFALRVNGIKLDKPFDGSVARSIALNP